MSSQPSCLLKEHGALRDSHAIETGNGPAVFLPFRGARKGADRLHQEWRPSAAPRPDQPTRPSSGQKSELRVAAPGPSVLSEVITQLALPGFESLVPACLARSAKRTCAVGSEARSEDPLLATYRRRLAARGAATRGIAAYAYQLRTVLRLAESLTSRSLGMEDIFRDSGLLGRTLVHDVHRDGLGQYSRWTLAQRRSAIRSFATLVRPELAAGLGRDPHAMVDEALRSVAERVGGGYRLSGGSPRRRGGEVPTGCAVDAVIAAMRTAPAFHGLRNAAFFRILAESGARVNALRELDGADCVVLPSGRVRLFVHEKGGHRRRQIELSGERAQTLRSYVSVFNRCASRRGWTTRIALGEPGPLWRNSRRGRWSYQDVAATLRAACAAADAPTFTPHALRRAFATDAASLLPRHTVALAGGWRGVERLDDHYVHPRRDDIWAKLETAQDLLLSREDDGDEHRRAVAAGAPG